MAVSDQTSRLHVTNNKPDNFVVDVALISPNSKQKLQRSLSRKTSPTNIDSQSDSKIVPSASPAPLVGAIILEKQNVGLTGQAQPHYKISINNPVNGGGVAESRSLVKSPGLRRSQTSWGFDPRKMFVLLASLSSMGTILLIYFTLSVSNPSGDDIAQS